MENILLTFSLIADTGVTAYVHDGLIAHWAGVYNQTTATHDASATTWRDLKTGLEFLLVEGDTVEENAMFLTNKTHPSQGSLEGQSNFWNRAYVTVEVSARQDGYTAKERNLIFEMNQRARIYLDTNYTPTEGSCFDISGPATTDQKAHMNHRNVLGAARTEVTNRHTYVNVCGISNLKTPYFDGVKCEFGSNYNSTDGGSYWKASNLTNYLGNTAKKVRYNAVRVYNRKMTDAEMFANAALDRMRFDNTAAADITWPDDVRWGASDELETRIVINSGNSAQGLVSVDGATAAATYSNWRSPNGSTYAVTAVPAYGYRFVSWQGNVGAANYRSASISVNPSLGGTITAIFAPANEAFWVFGDNLLSNVVNGFTFKASLSGSSLTITGWTSNGTDGIADLWRLKKYSMDRSAEYEVTALGSSFCNANTGITEAYFPDGIATMPYYGLRGCTKLGVVRLPADMTMFDTRVFQSCSAISNFVGQFLPPTVTTFRKAVFNGCSKVCQPLILSNPSLTAFYDEPVFNSMSKLPSVDLTGCGLVTWQGANDFASDYSMTNFTFNAGFASIKNITPFSGCSGLRRMRFRGDPPSFVSKNPFDSTAPANMAYYAPKWNKNWEEYIAAQENCTTSAMTSAKCQTFAGTHFAESMPLYQLKISNLSPVAPLKWWFPDAPPYYEAVAYHDVAGYDRQRTIDGGAADPGFLYTVSDGDAAIFDGTVWTLWNHAQTNFLWTAASGHSAEIALGASATTARELKFTGYRLHQLSMGDTPNGRAPTRWTLSGKTSDAGAWQTIHTYTMTSESEKQWAYFGYEEYSETVPAQSECALEFTVPAAVQKSYVAFRFTPENSYNLENGVEDATPFGLMELELLGEVLTPDPEIGAFAVAASRWSGLDFSATVAGLGKGAVSGGAWVEVAAASTFETIVAVSPTNAVLTGEAQTFAISGLAGATDYHARIIVTNDLGRATTNVLGTTASTLTEPWAVTRPSCDLSDPDDIQIEFSVNELYLAGNAEVSVYVADTPGGEYRLLKGPVTVSGAGAVAFDLSGFATDKPTATVKVTVSGGGVTRDYLTGVRSFWLADADSAPTQISNMVSSVTFSVSSSGNTNLTLKAIQDQRGETVIDFTVPIVSANDQPMALASVGSVFQYSQTLEEIRLPDYLTSIPGNAFNACSVLKTVRLPANLTSLGSCAFQDCPLLETVEPFLPRSLTYCGDHSFLNDYKLKSRLYIPVMLTTIEQYAFSECHALGEIEFVVPRSSTFTFGTANFWDAGITNILPKAFPPNIQFGTRAFKACPIQGRLEFESTGETYFGEGAFTLCHYITELDFSKCGSVRFYNGEAPLGSMSRVTRLVFPAGGVTFRTDSYTFSGGSLKEVVFEGAPPTFSVNPIDTASGYRFEIPAEGERAAEWKTYLEEHSDWVRDLTAAETKSFRASFPTYRPRPKRMLNLGGLTGYHYLTGQRPTPLMIILR